MSYRLTDEQIEKAVNWWAERIEQPTFDAGADSPEMKLAEAMAQMLTSTVAEGCTEKFKNELRSALKKEDFDPWHGIHTDYHPDPILFEAAKEAGVNENNFPWKSSMYFRDDGSVQVSLGYGAVIEDL